MAQIILIENNTALHDLIALNLSTYLGAEVIPRGTAADAIDLMSILPKVDLVICQNQVEDEMTAELLCDFIEKQDNETSLIVLGDLPASLKERALEVKDPKDWEKVVEVSAKTLGFTENVLEKKIVSDYVPIPIRYFLPLDSTCCDVFIRIKKGPGEFQYVKRIHQEDTFSKAAIKKYMAQKLEYFYIAKEFQKNFTIFVSNKILSTLEDYQGELDDQIELIGESYNIAAKEIMNIGFTSATVQLTEVIISSMLETIQKSPVMGRILHKVINSDSGYLYQASHMKAIVASECLTCLGVNDPVAHERIAYAAFFHDISFVDNEDLSKINSYEGLEKSELSEENWDLVFNHAFEASVLVKKNTEAPKDIDIIIKHHHGSSNGKGFNVVNLSKLPAHSRVFIIASEFVEELLAFKEKGGEAKPIVENLYEKYPEPEMKKIIKALEQTLKKKES